MSDMNESSNESMGVRVDITLDCAPGGPRPGDLLPGILAGTGIVLGAPISKFFGAWTWAVPADQVALYRQHESLIGERITELYNSGRIRYADW